MPGMTVTAHRHTALAEQVTYTSTAGTVHTVAPLHLPDPADVPPSPAGAGTFGPTAVATRPDGTHAVAYVRCLAVGYTLHLEQFPAGSLQRPDGAPMYPFGFGDVFLAVHRDHLSGHDVHPAHLAQAWLEHGLGLVKALGFAHNCGASWEQVQTCLNAATHTEPTVITAAVA